MSSVSDTESLSVVPSSSTPSIVRNEEPLPNSLPLPNILSTPSGVVTPERVDESQVILPSSTTAVQTEKECNQTIDEEPSATPKKSTAPRKSKKSSNLKNGKVPTPASAKPANSKAPHKYVEPEPKFTLALSIKEEVCVIATAVERPKPKPSKAKAKVRKQPVVDESRPLGDGSQHLKSQPRTQKIRPRTLLWRDSSLEKISFHWKRSSTSFVFKNEIEAKKLIVTHDDYCVSIYVPSGTKFFLYKYSSSKFPNSVSSDNTVLSTLLLTFCLNSTLSIILDEPSLCNQTITFTEESIEVNKYVLAAHSTYFRYL
ncbi:hypothetical protein GEMRC1_009747 [Eukaryota sp. GEM-RC1]